MTTQRRSTLASAKRRSRAAAVAGLGAAILVVAAAHATDSPRELATVDGTSITTRDLDALLAAQKRPEPGAAVSPSLTADGLLKRLIQNRLLEEEGYRIGAEKESEVKDQVWDFKVRRGMVALLDSVSADAEAPDSAALGAVLDRTSTMWRVSHIRLGSERFARALMDSLSHGASFSVLARRYSTDTTSAARGGDLGWAREDLYIPEFRSRLSGLAKGGIAGPTRTDDGWHILLLADTRTETVGQSGPMREQILEAAKREGVMKKVSGFAASLREKYGVVVNDSLVASLDYGSKDPAVQSGLRTNEAVVATLPWRTVDVRELTRRIRFQYFHGIEDKPDAAQIRDKVLDDWLTELLLRHETTVRGFDERPEIVAEAAELERGLIRESVGKKFLDVPFDPAPAEVERYWVDHAALFTPPARVMADGVLLVDESAAKRFREQLDAGARLRWLAARTSGVMDPKPQVLVDWVEAASLGLAPSDLEVGRIVGPVRMKDAWAVATVTKVETVLPAPLDRCRDQVVAAMKVQRTRDIMTRALSRLESAAKIRIAEGAHEAVTARLEAWLSRTGGTTSPNGGSPGTAPTGRGEAR